LTFGCSKEEAAFLLTFPLPPRRGKEEGEAALSPRRGKEGGERKQEERENENEKKNQRPKGRHPPKNIFFKKNPNISNNVI
jgi:hypothetical protein